MTNTYTAVVYSMHTYVNHLIILYESLHACVVLVYAPLRTRLLQFLLSCSFGPSPFQF